MAKILVIDDDRSMCRLIARILSTAGHDVHKAANGREGISLFGTEQPTLVITDIVMPDTEGMETIVTLRKSDPNLRILAISGGGQVGNASYLDLATKLGADAAIAKPFRAEELLAAVGKLLAE
jgi:DNA-binding response OmpR family regulator